VGVIRALIGGLFLTEADFAEFFAPVKWSPNSARLRRVARPIAVSPTLAALRRTLLRTGKRRDTIEAETQGVRVKIGGTEVTDIDIYKAACVLKRKRLDNLEGDILTLVVKELHVQVNLDFELWMRPAGKFVGTSEVSVRGVQGEFDLEVGGSRPLNWRGSRVLLGSVIPTVRFTNGTLISEMLAHGVLDYFEDALTRTIEDAATTALNDWAKDKLEEVRYDHVTQEVAEEVLRILILELPTSGYPV
jgi:hypothetical protein